MKQKIKNLLRSHCPNITILRRRLNRIKLKDINKYMMKQEDILSGEASIEKQEELVDKYSKKWSSYVKMLNEKLDEYISQCEAVRIRDDLVTLRVQVLFVCFAYGFMPDEFFVFGLEGKTPQERKSYISDRDRKNYVYKLNDIIDLDIFLDKYKTYKNFKMYYQRDAICVEKQSDYKAFLEFVKKHPVFVQKNVGLSKGDSVELVDSTNSKKSLKQLFDEMIADGKYIIEERVIQSSYMARLSRKSVNTVRCMTFLTNHSVEIGPCFFKMGKGDSFVDNAGAGGIVVGIDRGTGQLVTDGFDEFCNSYIEHPDTHIAIKGFQLPQWDELIALVKKLAYLTPTVRYIGWDLAHTETGWVIIEGNGSGQFIIPQIVWQRGFKREIERYMQDIDLLV